MSFFGKVQGAAAAVLPSVVIGQPPRPANLGARVLRLGCPSGDDVAWLQRAIGVKADGIFGPMTQAAVAAWQRDQGILSDGIVGPGTWRALGVDAPTARPVFVPPIVAVAAGPMRGRILRALTAEKVRDAEGWADLLAQEFTENGIVTAIDAGCALGNFLHETGRFTRLVENMHYTTEQRLMEVWPSRFTTVASATPYLRNGPLLAEKVYGGRMGNNHPGDAWMCRGRGLIMITGLDAYLRMASDLGLTLEALIGMLETRDGAAKVACRWWKFAGISRIAVERGPEAVRLRVNGGRVGMVDALACVGRVMPYVTATS